MQTPPEQLAERLQSLLTEEAAADRLLDLLEEYQPYDLAEALAELGEEPVRRALAPLEPVRAAEVLEHMEYIDQYRLLHHMEPETAQAILDQYSTDEVVDLIQAIHPRQAEQLLQLLQQEYGATIRGLLNYPESSAGGRMTIDYISVRQYMTAEQVLAHVRKVGSEAETVSYIYVVDSKGLLTGVISLRELIFAAPRTRVSEFMNTRVISVPATMDQEEVARVVSQYDLLAVPVVSAENHLLGIITVDDVIDVLEEEASEDVYRMGATSAPEEGLQERPLLHSVWALARPRLPWLIGLLFMELGTGVIVESFSGLVTPTAAAMLALLTIVMAGESGNAATQALAMVVRGLATGEIKHKDMPRVVLREALVGLTLGVVVGGTLLVVGWLWQDNLQFGLAAGLALMINLIVAKTMGSLFPVLIHRVGIDPAVASGPFITTITDNTSMLVYYGLASIIMRGVM